jgi:ribonucleoside-diphosphate reductase alpha chain
MVTQIATETRLTLYDGITTEEMDLATINAAVQNIKEDIEYDKVADTTPFEDRLPPRRR